MSEAIAKSSFACAGTDSATSASGQSWLEERVRSACAGESFYKKFRGKEYCVLHFPAKEKSKAFSQAFQKKIDVGDFNFCGVWFPDRVDFTNFVFGKKPDFSLATFNGGVSFHTAEFSKGADFAHASFYLEADFYVAKFIEHAEFFQAVFKANATFTAARFEAKANFPSTVFNAVAGFYNATFNSEANFTLARFKSEADFMAGIFNAEADFSSTNYEAVAHFSKAKFKGDARFHKCHFSNDAHFSDTTFGAGVYFNVAIFDGYVRFSGTGENKVFGIGSIVDLKFARMEKPNHVLFNGVQLRPYWFLNMDPSKFNFVNVEWPGLRDEKYGIVDEIKRTKERGPHRLLSIVCRQLAINAEDNQRYEEASRFRYWAMDVRRREDGRGAFWRLNWWYWLASGYGERFLRAFMVLIVIWMAFSFLYLSLDAQQWKSKQVSNEMAVNDSSWDERNLDFRPFKDGLRSSFIYSLSVMTLQKPDDPRPDKSLARMLVAVEAILGPLQIALLALAIRRQFMK